MPVTLQAWIVDVLEGAIERAREGLRFRPLLQMEITLARALAFGVVDELATRFPSLLGVDVQNIDLKEILKALLPLLQIAAAKTPNAVDDWIVQFLAKFVTTGESPSAIMAAMPPPPV